MIRAIHHAYITVPPESVAAARDFYCRLLGLREIPRPPGVNVHGFWVAVGDRALHVGLEKDINRFATRGHVAYEVDDLAAVREKLIAAGHQIEDPVQIAGLTRFHTRDPFGNFLEFLQPK
jgi:catechol 2,3-dioxygenase-like lactoylglutathione lyase family enzyme